jgi:2-polyprenyl-3-methyl-5-hydroxy-6-metoxy-1,4-benzoquinol methylase
MRRLLMPLLKAARFIAFPFVTFAFGIYWIFVVILFSPVILADALFGWTRRRFAHEPEGWSRSGGGEEIFDRSADVSKLVGCNTRNVRYRWDIFASALDRVEREKPVVRALDFGAGSLRDSFEMVKRGYQVTSIDLDAAKLRRHFAQYDWKTAGSEPELVAGSLEQLAGRQFDVITAFDVMEHSDAPEPLIEKLHSLLSPGGVFLVTVPNGRTLYEKHNRVHVATMRRMGIKWIPGEPHLHFRTPAEWQSTFERGGFKVRNHDMAIGALVNDLCHTAVRIPLHYAILPVVDRLARVFGKPVDREHVMQSFYPRWLTERVDLVDRALKPVSKPLYGWNLFVLERAS